MNPLEWFPAFMRPWWLLGLLSLPLIAWWWRARARRQSVWRQTVDAHLLPHLLQGDTGMRSQRGLWIGLTAAALASIAMAGPSWRASPQPLWQTKAPLVIALNLSSASLANDLPPSRLLQARAKIAQLLQARTGGQVGLVAYADDAFTVAPLTDDTANVALFLDALSPEIMPVDGDNAARAIEWSQRLLSQAGFKHGDILLLTHGADPSAQRAAAAAARSGYRVSALGLGNALGSAYRQRDGSLAHTQLDANALRALTRAGNGTFAAIARGDADLRGLKLLDPQNADAVAAQGEKRKVRLDQGYWLLPPLLLLALLAFRRGGVLAALLLACVLPLAPMRAQAQASPPSTAASNTASPAPKPAEGGLWRRADQQAYAHAQQGRDAYRKGDFAAAANAYARVPGAEGAYNLGNALAKQGQYQQAIDAYDRALRQAPGMPDAVANRDVVLKRLQRKPPPGQRQQQNQNRQQNPNSQNPQNAGQSAQQGQNPQQTPQQGQNQNSPPPQQQPPSPPPQDQPTSPQQKSPSQQTPQSGQPQNPAQAPADPAAQAKADAAQRERMQRELAKQNAAQKQATQATKGETEETAAEREQRIATEAWIKRVPDDPGGLLRAKFQLEYERRRERGER